MLAGDSGPILSLTSDGLLKAWLERAKILLWISLEMPWLVMWKKPHSLHACEREDSVDRSRGLEISKTGSSSKEVSEDSFILPARDSEISKRGRKGSVKLVCILLSWFGTII